MNLTDSDLSAVNSPETNSVGSVRPNRYFTAATVMVAGVLITFVALSRSFFDGRLANPITHNDVNYFIDGIWHLLTLQSGGFFALVRDFFQHSMHAPFTTYQAMLAYAIFGFADWAPYASNFVFVVIFFGFAAFILADSPKSVIVAAIIVLAGMPITSMAITEFAPEIMYSLFTSIGAVLMLNEPLVEASLRSRIRAGLWFGVGLLAHPSAFAFTFIALAAVIGLMFLRESLSDGFSARTKERILCGFLNLALSLWLPALYMLPRYDEYWSYFYDAILNPKMKAIWGMQGSTAEHIAYYAIGGGGQFMFGNLLWGYVGLVILGIIAAFWRRDRRFVQRQLEFGVLSFVFYLVPTLALAKAPFFGASFGFLVAFMAVIALRSVYLSLNGIGGAVVVSILAVLLSVSVTSRTSIANIPPTFVDREVTLRAFDRFRNVLHGNAVKYHGTKVYMTNIGAYAPNVLQYYLLRSDPHLDWTFDSKWMDPDPNAHLEFIRGTRPDFIIAGEAGNGLTYSPFAIPAEDPVLNALRKDSDYMAIDSFYGPQGRSINVFQRRVSFAGWTAISGITEPPGLEVAPRFSRGTETYVQTYAANPARAQLLIDCGGAVGQTMDVFVNQHKVGQWSFGGAGELSLVRQEIDLVRGLNDIVLRYSSGSEVTFRQFQVVPVL
jgi:hypothetical protein